MALALNSLILEALQRAAAAPEGLPLVAGRSVPGLFGSTAVAKQAAQLCKERGLLQVVRTQSKGRTAQEICALTENGWHHLLENSDPRPIFSALLSALERNEQALRQVTQSTEEQAATLRRIHEAVTRAADHFAREVPGRIRQASPVWLSEAIEQALRAYRELQPLGDCPLPDIWHRLERLQPPPTLGQFHDCLRELAARGSIALQPWSGPLYEMPEPAVALLSGHEIAYYACLR